MNYNCSVSPNIRSRIAAALVCLAILFSSLTIPDRASAATKGVTNAKVVLRKSASTKSQALQTVYKGTEITILDAKDDWYKVRYGRFTGYMMKKYVTANGSVFSSSSSSGSSSSAAEKIKALGSAPGPMYKGDENSDVKKLQQALQILGYYKGRIDGDYGDETAAAVKSYQKKNGLEADGFAGKLTVTKLFGSCRSNSLTKQKETASGTAQETTTKKYSTVSSISKIGSAPSATEKGSTGTNVVKLQQALEVLGYYKGEIDGEYGNVTVDAVKRFQKKNGLYVDGVAGPITIKQMFGKSAVSSGEYLTETLDWYKDNVGKVIPKKAVFTVKDVKTGKTFEMVRWSGGDHMDAEPRTKKDTETLKSIYGGSFSWDRRAILILYKDHVYAASMNGMPHGTSTISNNFDGHVCIHFKNSRTHETDRVDSDHQKAVNKASNAKW